MRGDLLEASLCISGYSSTKPPWPIVSFTWTMEWQTRHPMPACDSGVSICSLIGRSILPVSSTAMSWQPPHHFDDFVPMVSCMYSIDLRYHWLLKDEKWCMEPSHWVVISG